MHMQQERLHDVPLVIEIPLGLWKISVSSRMRGVDFRNMIIMIVQRMLGIVILV